MNRRAFMGAGAAALIAGIIGPAEIARATAGDNRTLPLPKPDAAGGKPLMDCLRNRRTNRNLSRDDLDIATLGSLFWAAWGVNRDDGRHVIPTGRNRQEILVYAVRGDGVWEYIPRGHAMKRVINGDRRGDFDGAGCILLYAAPARDMFAPMHVGAMFQNVGLYCAATGLANCVKYQRRDALDAELPLPDGWMVHISHSVAKPAP